MSDCVRRGFVPTDEKEFSGKKLEAVRQAAKDLLYLINRNYKVKGASTLVGNHYMLSERQRLALVRGLSKDEDVERRQSKLCQKMPEEVNIDGFNLVVTLEVALSGSLLIKGADGTIRDLAGLRGNYRIIDKTEKAVRLILETLDELKIKKANVYLDAPVSNSGRLKQLFLVCAKAYDVKVEVQVENSVDSLLSGMSGVVSTDAIILNQCQSWVNLGAMIIEQKIPESWCVAIKA